MVTDSEKQRFLNQDFYDALRWLLVGAVAWVASEDGSGNRDPLAMLASITQARALYEFFYDNKNKGDNARAQHFCKNWNAPESVLYKNYMAAWKPANKRVFHLVYNRPIHSGGVADDESSHIKNQVLNFARDLRQITEQFVQRADCQFTFCIQTALKNALQDAAKRATVLKISNPFDGEV